MGGDQAMNESLPADDSIQRIVSAYSDMIYRIAFTRLTNRQDAEDIVQSVFVKYIEKQPAFASLEHEKAWLIRVTVNLCRNYWHKAWFGRHVALDETLGYLEFDYQERDEKAMIRAIMELPANYRVIILLFYYEELSVRQIASACRMNESTVRSHLFRARALLRSSLKGAFTDE
jgi:RNA polymerase sigma-70 factor, ECF subfamily